MNQPERLRKLPSVDELLRSDSFADLLESHSRMEVVTWVRLAVDACRQHLSVGQDMSSDDVMANIFEDVLRRASSDRGNVIQHVINATGVLLHTNLGRAPLAQRAIERMGQAAAYSNVELDLSTGKRAKRGSRVAKLVTQLVGGDEALIVNNCAAATMLVLQSIAAGREVIVSRGQLVEIGGGFRLPEVFAAAGVELREVGTTNRTYASDYEAAINEHSGAIIRVHHSNFKQTGFVTEPTVAELVQCDRPENLPVIDDVGSGCIYDLSPWGLNEPSVVQSLASGADVTLFSGDKLLGGPQCGIIVGRKCWIELMRASPLMRAMRVDKLTIAALEATLEIHLAGNAFTEIPLFQMLATDPEELRDRCLMVIRRLGSHTEEISVVECQSQIGGGAMPEAQLDSIGLRIESEHVDQLAAKLRSGSPAIQARIVEGSLVLDFRTVMQSELESLAARLSELLS